MKVLKEFIFSSSHYMPLRRWKNIGHFSLHFHTSSNFLDLLHSMLCIKIHWHIVYAVILLLTIEKE